MRTFLGTFVFLLTLTACQSLGLQSDPQRTTKVVLASAGIMTDAVGVYGHLPPCPAPDPCRKEDAYRDAKLIAQQTLQGFEVVGHGGTLSPISVALFAWTQYQVAKTLADQDGPTKPGEAPTPQTVSYLVSIGLADVLVSTADDRIRDAASVNTTSAELLADLRAKVQALP